MSSFFHRLKTGEPAPQPSWTRILISGLVLMGIWAVVALRAFFI